MKISSSAAVETWFSVIGGSVVSRDGSMNEEPDADEAAPSGTSLPMVSALTTHALCRMPRTLTHASADVMPMSDRGARPADGHRRPVVAERDGDAGHHARLAGGAREPLHPADFERDEASERRAGVDVRSAGAVEPAADFGEAQRDGQRRDAHQHEPDRAPRADLRRDLRRHRKIAPPITWLMPIAVRSQRPSARLSVVMSTGGCIMTRRHPRGIEPVARHRATMHTTLPRASTPIRTSTARSSSASTSTAGSAPGAPIRFRNAGDYFTRALGDESVIVTRDGSGDIHALFNVCRHRGTRLCEQPEGHFADRIQCPYHDWTYDLDGRLLAAPHMAPEFRKDDYPLHRAGCEVWDGHIFVHLGREGQDGRDGDARVRPARAICRTGSPRGGWATSDSAGASSTTSRRTGS